MGDDERLIKRLRGSVKQGAATWRCLSEARLAAFAEGRLDDTADRAVEAHLADCGYCAGQLASLLRLDQTDAPSEVGEELLAQARRLVVSPEAPSERPHWRWAAVAAAAGFVAIGTSLWMRPSPSPPAPASPAAVPLRTPSIPPLPRATAPVSPARTVRGAPTAVASPELLAPREGALVGVTDVEFRWSEVRRSLFYEVRVTDLEGSLMWQGRTEERQVRLPPAVRLTSGEAYFVWVRAHLPEGRTVESRVVGFRAR